jgi:hypothetical protein
MDNIFNEWIRVIKCRDKEFNGRRKGGEGGIRGGKELGGGIRRETVLILLWAESREGLGDRCAQIEAQDLLVVTY